MPDLLVNEVYGPVFEGEGRFVGQRCFFVRLGGCNLHCSWCDTPQTWVFDDRHMFQHNGRRKFDPKNELIRYDAKSILDQLSMLGCTIDDLVSISGGEPLLQAEALDDLVTSLLRRGRRVTFETAGTRSPSLLRRHFRIHWTVSPKLESSGNEIEKRYIPEVIDEFRDLGADFKFVISSKDDLSEVTDMLDAHGISTTKVWLMPEGTNAAALLDRAPAVEEMALKLGCHFTLRQQTLLHGNKRGY
jgi:organic radical activating enzyme